ncbi:Fur family transcriptional regulator [Kozakia baliensis]|uniref:Ferric uptake regulation protein n=1 Tax=Kozakia baliensis TaxID=153496 RepID=A0A1D8UW25_9PROT|nr:Fur family transcriptional regulator [Kozakia baliensis]AOX17843.1 transcriptional repressor [Kozakia baliensis]AOX20664.1 transcriptional repressor [Kozakia baliensis]GBR33493.1 Fur family transcriptional regulator [Kozakia baliensis NRIC 0488]GEL64936.1 transcriptional repressor [Kozakia baliensis]
MAEVRSPASPLLVLCRKKKLRLTGQRRVVAYVISNAEDHPDVEEIYRRALKVDPYISIATVYRTVRLFEENGILYKRDFGSGRARYERTDEDQHYHLIDADSGQVLECEDKHIEDRLRQVAADMGYDLVTLRLSLCGRRKN